MRLSTIKYIQVLLYVAFIYASGFDSLSVRFVGNLPYGYSWDCAANIMMGNVYSGSGGAVFILNTSTLQKVSEIRTRGRVVDIISDPWNFRLFIASEVGGIEIWDVTNPSDPVKLSRYWTDGTPMGLYLNLNNPYYLYVADGANQLVILDVSDPTNPIQVGHFAQNGFYAKAVWVDPTETYAYLVGWPTTGAALKVIDVSNPAQPTLVDTFFLGARFNDIFVLNQYAYLSATPLLQDGGIRILDLSDLTQPQEVAVVDGSSDYRSIWVVPNGGQLYAYAANESGLVTMDLTDPQNPVILNDSTGIPAYKIYAMGLLYAAGMDQGLQIVNPVDPANPMVVGTYDFHDATGELRAGVCVKGPYAYLSYQGLTIVDISDLSYPVVVSTYTDTFANPPYVFDIDVEDTLAYLAWYDAGFQIVDVSDPTNPVKIGAVSPNPLEFIVSIDVQGDYAYLGTWNYGLKVIDISDPSNPVETGSWAPVSPPIMFSDIKARGQYVYIVDQAAQFLRVIDVSDPYNPVEVSNLGFQSSVYALYLQDQYAFVSGGNNGLYVVDISDATNPSLVAHSTLVDAYASDGAENYLYLSAGYEGLYVLDISNPLNPELAGYYTTPGFVNGIAASGEFIFVTNGFGQSALQVYENLSYLSTEELVGGSPNAPTVKIYGVASGYLRFYLPNSSTVVLDVFDVIGRRVYSQIRFFPQGLHELFLPLKEGVYVARMDVKGRFGVSTVLRKFVFLRR